MIDNEVLQRAKDLCDRGPLLSSHETIDRPRLRRIVDPDDEVQARYLVPALLEIIERRGLR